MEGFEKMSIIKDMVRLWATGRPGVGKSLLLEKIANDLMRDGFVVSKPVKHEKRETWFIDVVQRGD